MTHGPRHHVAAALALLLLPLAAEARDCARLSPGAVPAVFDFGLCGAEGWRGGFADLPASGLDDPAYDLRSGPARLPRSVGPSGRGLRLAGTNRSDDLFMFAARRLAGLRPSTRYAAAFRVEIAADAGPGCLGAGGAPGEAVYVKAGGGPARPRVAADEGGVLRLNRDISSQSRGGADAIVLDDAAGPGAGCAGGRHVAETPSSRGRPFFPITDRGGGLWAVVGFDCGYEGRSDLYLDRVRVELSPVAR